MIISHGNMGRGVIDIDVQHTSLRKSSYQVTTCKNPSHNINARHGQFVVNLEPKEPGVKLKIEEVNRQLHARVIDILS